MGPKVDRTVPRACSICGDVKPPDAFAAGRGECKPCGSKKKAAKAADDMAMLLEAHAPRGTRSTASDFCDGLWTITEGAKSAPKARVQKYVRVDEISASFVASHGLPGVIRATSCSDLVAHAGPCGKELYVAASTCLDLLGVKKCSRCGVAKGHGEYADAGAGNGQLRGECRSCQKA